MNRLSLAALAATPLALAACSEPAETPDTSYEESLPAPVEDAGPGATGVADNDTMENGPDEQVDAQYSGENQLPDTDKTAE